MQLLKAAEVYHTLEHLLVEDDPESRATAQVEALLRHHPPEKIREILYDTSRINGLKLTDPNDGTDIPILASVRTRLLAFAPFLNHCQNLAGPPAIAPIYIPSLTRTSFERYIDFEFDEANPTVYDAAEACDNYRFFSAMDMIPFQDPSSLPPANNNNVTAAAPPLATAQPMRAVTYAAEKKKKQAFSHTPINNLDSINVAAAKMGKQAEKHYFRHNNMLGGRSRTHRFPPSLTNTSTDVAVSSTNIVSPQIDVVSDLRDNLGESVENVEIASEAIKISMREKCSMGDKCSTSKDAGLEPAATTEDAETELTMYRPTNNKLTEDLISGGVWELLSDSGKASIKELADTDLHSIASSSQEQYSSNDDGDATPSVVKGRTDSNSRHQNRVNISEVIADDKDASEATLSTCDGSDVEFAAHDDPFSDDSTNDLFSADLAPPSADDEDDLSTISSTIIPRMLTAHKATMDEVMEDLDIRDVRSHDNVGLILVADRLHAFNIDIECESAAAENKVDYESRDDEFSDRDDDNATSIHHTRHTNATVRGDAPNSADDAVEIHQYPPFNDGATRFTLVDGGCNGNFAIDDVRHIDDIMSLLDLDDSGAADDVGVGSVADELVVLDIEHERAVDELRLLTEYKGTTKETKVGYAAPADDVPTSMMLDGNHFVLPRLGHDATYIQGHVESPHSINYSDVFVFDHLDSSSQADDDPSIAFWPIDIDAPCITHGLAVLTAKLAFEAQSIQFDRGFYDAHRGRILYHSGVRMLLSDLIITWMDMIPEWKMGRVTIIAINHQRLIFVLILGESDTKLLRLIYMNTIRAILWEMGYFHQPTSAHTLLHQPIAHAVVVASPGSYHQDDVGTTQSSRHHLMPAFMASLECVVWGEIQLVQSYLGRRLTHTRMHGTDVKLCDDDRPDADLHIIYYDVDPCTGHRFICTSDMQLVVETCHISVSGCNHITSLENWGENDSDVGLDLRLLADASHPRHINVERLHDIRIADLQVGTCNGLQEMRLDAKWNSSQFGVAQLHEENGERDYYAPLPKENGQSHHCRNVESDGIPEGEMKEHTTKDRPMSDEDSVDSGTHFECNGVRQCYDKEYKHTTMALKLGMTTAYRVRRRVYRMTTAKENGEPSEYSAGEKLTYGNHDFELIRFDDKYSRDTDVGCEHDPTRKIHSELVREEVTCITLLCKSFIHDHCKRRALRNLLQANENSLASIYLPRYPVMGSIVPRSAFVGQDFEAFGKWLYGVKVASLWGAMHSEDDVCVTFPDIICFGDEVTVIVDTTIDGEREITSTIPVVDMEQSYEEERLKLRRITDAFENVYKLKLEETGPLSFLLGCDYFRDSTGTLCQQPKRYIAKMEETFERLFGKKPKHYTSPLEKEDHPECDTSELLGVEETEIYQSTIDAAQWLIQLGRFDTAVHVMTLSSFRASPWRGHLDRIERVYGYALKMKGGVIRYCTEMPDMSDPNYAEQDWSQTPYAGSKEEAPKNAPCAIGKPVRLITSGDANPMHELLTSKAVNGLLHFINKTPFDWYSKKQNTVETAAYKAESITGGTAIEQAALTTGAFKYVWVDGKDNVSDVLTKHWGYQQVWPLIRPILFWEGDTMDILRGPRKVMKSITKRLRGK